MEENNSSSVNNIKAKKSLNLNTEFDVVLFFHLFKKNLLWIFLIIISCVTVSFIYLRYTAPVFESRLVYQVNSINAADKILDVNTFQEADNLAKDVEILKSKLVFKKALKRIPIDVSYYNQGEFLANELYTSTPIKVEHTVKDSSVLGEQFFIKFIDEERFELTFLGTLLGEFETNKIIELPKLNLKIHLLRKEDYDNYQNLKDGNLFFKINSYESLTNNYISRLSVSPINNAAKTINISFRDHNAKKTKDIVTAIAKEYSAYDIEERSKSSKKALEFIDTQLDKYYNKVKGAENKIQEFQQESNFSTMDRSSIYFNQSNKLEDELFNIDLQRKILSDIKNSIPSKSNDVDVYNLLPILAGTEYAGGIMSLITTLKELLIQKENLQFEVTTNSEAVKSLEHQIEIQKKILLESLTSSDDKLSLRRTQILSKINQVEKKFLNIPTQELEYARLQRILSLDEKFYNLLMEKRTEYSISEAGFVTNNIILDKALLPTSPDFPNKKMFLLTGFMLGIVFSIILLLIKYIFKNTISSIDEIMRYSSTEISILGVIPKYKRDIPVSQLVVNKNPKSIIAESFRVIRSNMQFISGAKGKKLLAITSTVSGEGKTFCAINMAGIIAFSGKKVVILDLDMRKPKIHLGFGVENTTGMSTLLIKGEKLSNCIHHSELENLDFITSGPVPPNPSELIINGELDNIIKELYLEYDFVIIDNPPVGLVSDAMAILKKADFPIYVFKNGYSKKYFINNIDKLILENKITKMSVILNAVEQGSTSYGSSYGGEYGYGGYYEDEPIEKKGLFKGIFGRKK